MNTYMKSVALSAIFAALVIAMPVFVRAQVENGGDDTAPVQVAAAPAETSGSSSNGSDDTSGAGSVSTGGSTSSSNTNGDDDTSGSGSPSTGGSTTGSTTNGDDDTNQNPSNPSTPGNPGNNGGTGGGSNGGGSSKSSATSTVALGGSCSYLSAYLKIDGTNNASEVTKLQSFLKNIEKLDVDINGKFDAKTFEAVKAFQAKHVVDIMGPWGVSTPTGQVYYTTLKKINEVYCNAKLTLTPAQLAEIEAYRKGIVAGTIAPEGTASTTPVVPSIGSTETGSSQTAAAAETSFGGKIWNFIKWLFGY